MDRSRAGLRASKPFSFRNIKVFAWAEICQAGSSDHYNNFWKWGAGTGFFLKPHKKDYLWDHLMLCLHLLSIKYIKREKPLQLQRSVVVKLASQGQWKDRGEPSSTQTGTWVSYSASLLLSCLCASWAHGYWTGRVANWRHLLCAHHRVIHKDWQNIIEPGRIEDDVYWNKKQRPSPSLTPQPSSSGAVFTCLDPLRVCQSKAVSQSLQLALLHKVALGFDVRDGEGSEVWIFDF